MNYERFKKIVIWLSLTCVFALPVAATFTSPVYAQGRYRRYDRDHDRWDSQTPGRWVYLGQANVGGRMDRDRVYVGRGRGRFQRIQIRVDRAPIEFQRVVVHYANGRSEDLTIRQRIPAGGQTRAIDLRGDDRAIDSVEFFYARGRWGYGRDPRVRLYGI